MWYLLQNDTPLQPHLTYVKKNMQDCAEKRDQQQTSRQHGGSVDSRCRNPFDLESHRGKNPSVSAQVNWKRLENARLPHHHFFAGKNWGKRFWCPKKHHFKINVSYCLYVVTVDTI